MATQSVLIVGGSGFVGTHLAGRLREGYKVFATYAHHPVRIPGVSMIPMDIENRNWIRRVILAAKPDVIIYLLGDTEKEALGRSSFTDMENLRSKGVANILNIAEMLQPKFIFLSSCYVYDGNRGNYRETEAAIPETLLGRAMVSTENLIRGRSLPSIIIRSSPLIGRGNGLRRSFLDRIRMNLDRGKPTEVVANELHSLAPMEGLVELLSEVIQKPNLRNRTLHYGGLTKVSIAEFAAEFASRMGYDPKLIVPINPAPEIIGMGSHRGERRSELDYSLNSSQAIELLKIKPLFLEEGFDLIEKKLVRSA